MSSKTIIVTGGAGFIGSNFTLYMCRTHADMRVICYDRLTYAGNVRYLDVVKDNDNFRFVKADICDRETVYRIFEEEHPHIVVNFAAESHVDRSIDSSDVFLQTNVIGTGVLLDACRKYGIRRFHQVSTDEVYGDLPLEDDISPEDASAEEMPLKEPCGEMPMEADRTSEGPERMFTESSPLHPNNPYSASKAAADHLVLAYHRTYGLPVTISRSSNNYGPRQHTEKLIPMVIRNAMENLPIPVYGDGRNMRDWLYVEDCCRAIDVILNYGTAGEIYNISAGNEISNIDLVKHILRQLKKPKSLITFVADRPGHDKRYSMDSSKERELGWRAEVGFEEGLKRTIEWYEEQMCDEDRRA